jgi:hypothetical protein
MTDTEDVRAVLERYRLLYVARDCSRLDEAMELFAPGDEPEMIGTEAVWRGDPDWAVGGADIRTLTEWDWRWWWDVELDAAAARVSESGDVAWASVPGALVQSDRAREGTCEFARETTIPRLREALAAADGSLEERLDAVAQLAGARARELRAPLGHRRALTFSAVLVRRAGRWLLHTTHWSIAAE